MINTQRSDSEKISLIEDGKKIDPNEVIKCDKTINKFKIVNIKWNIIV